MDYKKSAAEPEIAVTNAVPAYGSPYDNNYNNNNNTNQPPIPVGHSRFYCEKCHTVSPKRNHKRDVRVLTAGL